MSFILNIETATKNCSVSLSKNGEIIALREKAEEGFSHAEKLHHFINEVCEESAISLQDLNAIAVSKGPGSYTGLRIGVSSAKGLAYSLDIPLISIDTLASFASKALVDEGLIIPMIDARRMEVYSAVYNKKHKEVRGVEAQILTSDSFQKYAEPIYFIGDCLEKAKSVLHAPNFIFLDDLVYPSAIEMGILSHQKFLQNDFEDVAYFEPFYLKDFLMTAKVVL